MAEKKTLVLGASINPERYSNRAIKSLRRQGHPVFAIGAREGIVDDVNIITKKTMFSDIHTVTIYLSPKNQIEYYNYILTLKPKRIIYNPGAENEELSVLAGRENIKSLEACTLVLLATGQY